MFYELTISNPGSKSTSSLSTKGFIIPSLIILSGITATFFFSGQPLINICWSVFVLTFAISYSIYQHRKNLITFLKIDDDWLSFYNDEKKELSFIRIDEIKAINTRFCLVDIHTNSDVFSINMSLIRKEKLRWEIKELIRNVAPGRQRYSAAV